MTIAEKIKEQDVDTLPVMERFYTIQGEGVHTGKAAYFIRLGGCDVGCHWCDVKESWDESSHPRISIEQLAADAAANAGLITVITGGEPTMHNLEKLTRALHHQGLHTHIETSGAHLLTGQWDWVCFSPKKFKAPRPEIYPAADELKVVIYNKTDFAWALSHAERVRPECALILQPEWSKREQMMPLIVEFVKANPDWQVGLQTHKYLNVP